MPIEKKEIATLNDLSKAYFEDKEANNKQLQKYNLFS